jgi:hypothetical protein
LHGAAGGLVFGLEVLLRILAEDSLASIHVFMEL